MSVLTAPLSALGSSAASPVLVTSGSAAAVSLDVGTGGSAVFSPGASLLDFPPLAARLVLRNKSPNFPEADFFPSPSVPSASEVASAFFSFFVPRVLKKDDRRLSLAGSGVVAVPFEGLSAVSAGVEAVGASPEAAGVPAAAAGSSPFFSVFSSAFSSFFSLEKLE